MNKIIALGLLLFSFNAAALTYNLDRNTEGLEITSLEKASPAPYYITGFPCDNSCIHYRSDAWTMNGLRVGLLEATFENSLDFDIWFKVGDKRPPKADQATNFVVIAVSHGLDNSVHFDMYDLLENGEGYQHVSFEFDPTKQVRGFYIMTNSPFSAFFLDNIEIK